MASGYDGTTQALIDVAQSALEQVAGTRTSIINLSGAGEINTDEQHSEFEVAATPKLQAPPKLSDFLNESDPFNTKELLGYLNDMAEGYLDKYFPAINNCLRTLPEEWLCGVISGIKPYGLDDTVFDHIWQKQRDRAHAARLSEQATLEANMSARGFSMPPGALVDLSMKLSRRDSDALQDVNRDVTIKQAEIKLDLLKFAEQEALRYKLGLMQAMADLYKVWAVLPEQEGKQAEARARAMAAYYQAIGSYYDVEVAFENLRLRAEELRVNVELDNQRIKVQANAGVTQPTALGAVAQAFGDIASGAASAASTLVAQIESL